jgi:anti-sigma regulatory factor (Ser/Thr protein kinase)
MREVRGHSGARGPLPGRLGKRTSREAVGGACVEAAGDLAVSAAYQPEPEAAAAARRFVREILRSWQRAGIGPGQDGLVDDAVLLTSELVTNAVLHAGTSLHLTCRLVGDAVEVAVVDYSPGQLVTGAQPGGLAAERTGGRGLGLPAKLASSWGVTYTPRSKTVWFRIGGVTADYAAPLTEDLARR